MVAAALLWCNGAHAAETHVYLLRGWFGVFSTGLDNIAGELNAKGISAQAIGHTAWRTTVSKIIQEHNANKASRVVLVGHSQGANNVIDMARALAAHNVRVDLLVTLVPLMQNPVPANVVRAINYYQSPGWGAPITPGPGFHGELFNIDVADDWTILHISIDKSARIHADIWREIAALSQAKEGAEDVANPRNLPAAGAHSRSSGKKPAERAAQHR